MTFPDHMTYGSSAEPLGQNNNSGFRSGGSEDLKYADINSNREIDQPPPYQTKNDQINIEANRQEKMSGGPQDNPRDIPQSSSQDSLQTSSQDSPQTSSQDLEAQDTEGQRVGNMPGFSLIVSFITAPLFNISNDQGFSCNVGLIYVIIAAVVVVIVVPIVSVLGHSRT